MGVASISAPIVDLEITRIGGTDCGGFCPRPRPVGRTPSGRPIGAQVVARPRSDAQLLRFATALETLVTLDPRIVTPAS